MKTHGAETMEKSITLADDGPYMEAGVNIDSAPEAAREEIRKRLATFRKDATRIAQEDIIKNNTIKARTVDGNTIR